jgi:hypothetical protein
MEQAEVSDTEIKNYSGLQLWFAVDGNTISLNPGQIIKL